MAAWPYNTAAWQKLRRAKLSDQPLCEVCLRREVVTIANTVDHIVAIEKGGDPFPPLDGLMSMCAPCHNSKTARMDRGNSKGGSRFKGCDVDGNPLDDADDWHTAPQGSPQTRMTHDVVVDTSQHINARQRPRVGDCGHVAKPGAFAGREAAAAGPSRGSRIELDANDSQEGWTPWV